MDLALNNITPLKVNESEFETPVSKRTRSNQGATKTIAKRRGGKIGPSTSRNISRTSSKDSLSSFGTSNTVSQPYPHLGQPESSTRNSAFANTNIYDILQDENIHDDDITSNYTKVQPVLVEHNDPKLIANMINNNIHLKQKYTMKFIYDSTTKKKQIKITSKVESDKITLIKYLKDNKIPHHSYANKNSKSFITVLKGFYHEEIDTIMHLLVEAGIRCNKVTHLGKSTENPLYVVHFDNQKYNINELNHNYKILNNIKIRWVPFKITNKRLTQCYNCQEYGHGASHCGKTFRCAICDTTHLPKQCPHKLDGNYIPSCVNCKKNHPAFSKECEHYIKYSQIIQSKRSSATGVSAPVTKVQQPSTPPNTQSTSAFPHLTGGELPSSSISQANNTTNHRLSNYNKFTHANNTTNPTNSNFNPKHNQINDNILNHNLRDKTQPLYQDFLNTIQDFQSIPNILETLTEFKKLVNDLKNTNCHKTRLAILINYTIPTNV